MLITVALTLIFLDAKFPLGGVPGIWLLPLLMFFALGTAFDTSQLLVQSSHPVSRKPTLLATFMIAISAAIPLVWPLVGSTYPVSCPVGKLGWIVVAAIAAIFLLLLEEMRRYGKEEQKKGTIERTCGGVFVSLYVGLPMAMLVALRCLGDGTWGLAALITMLAVTKSADAGAYFTGKSLGKHKLIPRLSPGKTWEGLIGGMLTASLVAYVLLRWAFPTIAGTSLPPGTTPSIALLANPLWGALLLGPLLTVAGLVGDLAESLIKRDAGAKDSGNWLPGLGGVWDVTDSLIASVMPAYLCFSAGVGW